ncbi:MAG: ribokinase [Rhodospirillaceae bacterium]|nr:ribokinase [Rhodospirillaceae bacterium]MBT5666749.1 ribokinase [Rhodospirillaceae bacterium]
MIVVFGSINIDLVQRTPHLPAPGETVLCDGYDLVPGGKGANQALAAARAGASTAMIGMVGPDAFAESALSELSQAGVDLTGVGRSTRPTGCASVHVAEDGENAIVVSSGANQTVTANQAPDSTFTPDTTVVLQMEIPLPENWAFLHRAHGAVRRAILNAAPAGLVPNDALNHLDILVVNEGEGAEIAAQAGLTTISLRDVPAQLARQYDLTCILTLGADGAIVASRNDIFSVAAAPVTPIDTTGAGDTFVGVLAAGLDANLGMRQAAARASLAASLTCTITGAQTSIPTTATIDANLGHLPKIETLN